MFNYQKLYNSRIKAQKSVEDSPFFKFINDDLADRIKLFRKDCENILIISNNSLLTKRLEHLGNNIVQTDFDEKGNIDFSNQKFDLIAFPYALHWVYDVPGFLKQIQESLKDDGIFIGSFAGSGSLIKLRRLLIAMEAATLKAHINHISPFIAQEQMTDLFKMTGFAENIVDIEKIELEYDSPIHLMKAIKKTGEANALLQTENSSYSITADMYKKLSSINDEAFIDQINLINFLAAKKRNIVKVIQERPNPFFT